MINDILLYIIVPRKVLKRVPKPPEDDILVDVSKTKIVELKIRPHVDIVKL